MKILKKKITCHYCGNEIEINIFSSEKICPHCGGHNDDLAIEEFEQEKNAIAQIEKKKTELKELFGSDEEVNLSFKTICRLEDSHLVYNLYTKIVYIRQAYMQGYSSFYKEHYCPFISPNGKYYKYIETDGKIVEIE